MNRVELVDVQRVSATMGLLAVMQKSQQSTYRTVPGSVSQAAQRDRMRQGIGVGRCPRNKTSAKRLLSAPPELAEEEEDVRQAALTRCAPSASLDINSLGSWSISTTSYSLDSPPAFSW
jgi:hypothetical protein